MAEYKILGRANEAASSGYKILGKAKEEPVNDLEGMEEPEGFFAKLPRNMLIGLAKLGHKTLNAPHESVEASENVLKGLGEPFAGMDLMKAMQQGSGKPVSSYIPQQEEHDYAGLLGQKGKGTLMDNLLQKGIEYGPELALGGGLLKGAARQVPLTQKMASRRLREAEKLIIESGLNPTPINIDLINDAVPFLPKTHATREMLEGAYSGEYKPAFAMQSQIGQHERNLRKSPLASERLLASQGRELKQGVLKDMEKGLRAHGLEKEAELVKGGIDDYRKYIKIRDTVFPVLKKLGFPVGGMALLGFGYKKGKNILD